MNKRIGLREAIRFHGHLGPYLVLGVLAGEFALRKLGCRRYFALKVTAWGVTEKPRSCLIDGLQLSTGATYGKGNIIKSKGNNIRVSFLNREKRNSMTLAIKKEMLKKLRSATSHAQAERLAREIYNTKPELIFDDITYNEVEPRNEVRPR